MSPLIIAHRTCPKDAPENSREGIRKAAEFGADAVEVDLRVSLDQRPYILHDWSLRRTAGYPTPLEATPSAIVERLHLGNGESLPSLSDALDALSPALSIAVDVKTPWAIPHLAREVKKRRLEARTLAWCTSALDVRYMRRFSPEVETAYLRDDTDPAGKLAFLAAAVRLRANAVSAHWQAIDASFVSTAHELGLKVYSWHGESDLTPAKLESGLDGLITDYPAEARAACRRMEQGAGNQEHGEAGGSPSM
jgi:glycerophosphoryl diester phosphodiesterase